MSYWSTLGTVACVVGAGGIAVVGAPLVLTGAGFTAGGIATGSVAAGVQSYVYGGAATGVFSALQSAGAVGMASSTYAGIGTVVGAAAGLVKKSLS